MKADTILSADVLDIIFENRNKKYGAYVLRKFYNNRLYKALGAVLLFVSVLCLFSFFHTDETVLVGTFYPGEPTLAPPPKDAPQPPKTPAPPAAHMPAAITASAGRVVITKDSNAVLPLPALPGGTTATITAVGTLIGDPGPAVMPADGPETPAPTSPAPSPAPDRNVVVESPEIMPAFPGGPAALRKFLERNLSNPQDLESGNTVTVKIKFVVGYDGNLKAFETVEDGGTAFNNEVMRVLKKMPQWTPGKAKGENVSVYYTLPVRFVGVE